MAPSLAAECARLQADFKSDANVEGLDVMITPHDVHVLKDHKCGDLKFEDEGHSTASSSTLSTQHVVGEMVEALLENGSGNDSPSEGRRWADFELDNEDNESLDLSEDDSGAPGLAWPENIDQDWSPDQYWSPEMCGWHWVPVAVVPMPWTSSMADGSDFVHGYSCALDLGHDSNAVKPVKPSKACRLVAWEKAEKKTSDEKAKRKKTKKRVAASERSRKVPSPGGASQGKGTAESEPTTMMIRNIPKGCTRAMLQSTFESEGFGGQFDFLYLPFGFDDWSILGHAFVNFLEHDAAERAMMQLNGRALWQDTEDKPCEVCWSKALQGLAPCIGRFRNSPVMHHSVVDQYKPMFFANGRRCDFPAPTRQIQPVRRNMQS